MIDSPLPEVGSRWYHHITGERITITSLGVGSQVGYVRTGTGSHGVASMKWNASYWKPELPERLTTPSKARIYNAALRLSEAWSGVDIDRMNLPSMLSLPLKQLFDLVEPGDKPDDRGVVEPEAPPVHELAMLICRLANGVMPVVEGQDRDVVDEIRSDARKLANRFPIEAPKP